MRALKPENKTFNNLRPCKTWEQVLNNLQRDYYLINLDRHFYLMIGCLSNLLGKMELSITAKYNTLKLWRTQSSAGQVLVTIQQSQSRWIWIELLIIGRQVRVREQIRHIWTMGFKYWLGSREGVLKFHLLSVRMSL